MKLGTMAILLLNACHPYLFSMSCFTADPALYRILNIFDPRHVKHVRHLFSTTRSAPMLLPCDSCASSVGPRHLGPSSGVQNHAS